MDRKRAMRLAGRWANGGVCTLREGEAKEYHAMCLAALREQERGNLHDVASYKQVTEPLGDKGFSDSAETLATKNQVKGIRMMSRPWQPQDLLDDLQLIIDKEPDLYLNDRRTTLCMARDFLREHFAELGWISVKERLPDLIPCNAGTAYSDAVIVWTDGKKAMIAVWDGVDFLCAADYWEAWGESITHWMPLPEPPKED